MRENLSQSHGQWHILRDEWSTVQESWRDKTTRYFEYNFWRPLDKEMSNYVRALENLADAIEEINYLVE